MQFREVRGKRATTIQAIRNTYDPTRKRGVQKVVGSFSKYAHSLDRAAYPDMTDAEFAEAEEHLKGLRTALGRSGAASKASSIPEVLGIVSGALSGPDDDLRAAVLARLDGPAVWSAIEALTKAMRKAGVDKPKAAKDTAPQPAPLLDAIQAQAEPET